MFRSALVCGLAAALLGGQPAIGAATGDAAQVAARGASTPVRSAEHASSDSTATSALAAVAASPTPAPTPPPDAVVADTATARPSSPAPPTPPAAPPAAAPAGPWFGLLQVSDTQSAAERAAGIKVASLELSWASYQPTAAAFDTGYAAGQVAKLRHLRDAGFLVTLDAGLQYPPSWVLSLSPSARFVNQYGDVYHGTAPGEDVGNAVFDPAVRNAEAAYIGRVAHDFGDQFSFVRTGGLLDNELRYPPATYNGHGNCYWAFDAQAQSASPVAGWRPGQPDQAHASAFLDYYLARLTDFQTWQLATYRQAFASATLQVLYPSWGLRPGDVAQAVARNLDGSTLAAGWGTLAMGLDWNRQVGAIGDARVMPYTTWLDRGDDGLSASSESPARYLLALAAGRGLRVAGENAGGNPLTVMTAAVARVRSLGLAGMMWMAEPQLLSGAGGAGLAAYSRLINS